MKKKASGSRDEESRVKTSLMLRPSLKFRLAELRLEARRHLGRAISESDVLEALLINAATKDVVAWLK